MTKIVHILNTFFIACMTISVMYAALYALEHTLAVKAGMIKTINLERGLNESINYRRPN